MQQDLAHVLASVELAPGMQLGGYELVRKIGQGGMGEVHEARSRASGEHVALKYLGHAHPTALHRFKREFRAVADVRHENLVELGELVVLGSSRAFYTMELVEGQAFHKYIRGRLEPEQLPNMIRLRRALRQLVAGLCHLHAAGFVHRDLKPPNVLVTRVGRVVILDFGLISERESNEESLSPTGALIGTPAYIAPEHAARQRADKPADLYAVGVMLFEAVSGTRPFVGSSARVLVDKQDREAPLLCEVVPDAPEDLVELCQVLLNRDPDARPSAVDLLTLLDRRDAVTQLTTTSTMLTTSQSMRAVSRDRDALLGLIDEAVAAVGEGQAVTVHLDERRNAGPGMLLDQFLHERVPAETSAALPPLVLRGRCLERESVPYKGIDPLVDALALRLRNMSKLEVAALQPKRAELLIQMFPVLGGIWEVDPWRGLATDKNEQRTFAQAALRELLAHAGQRHRLIVCIEDFHWADPESARILSEIVRAPGSPRMLLIVSFDRKLGGEALAILEEPANLDGRNVRELEVGPLSPAETRALALELLGDALVELTDEQRAARVESCVERSGGDPFYLQQLIAQAAAGVDASQSLDELVIARLYALPEQQRELLAIVGACDGPCSVELAAQVSDRSQVAVTADLESMVRGGLLRRTSGTGFQTTHRIIRECALAEFEPHELVELHRKLAEAFAETSQLSFEAVATHYAHAGDRQQAAAYYEQAATHAAAALAFERAADLYRTALRLLPKDASEDKQQSLEAAIAEQLINAGRGLEAVEMLSRLAERASASRTRSYRRLATELLIHAGRVEPALELIAPVFDHFGEQLPRSGAKLMLTLVWRRVRLRVRGRKYELREDEQLDAHQRERLDTLLSVWAGLTHQETRLATTLHARYFHLALDAGEPLRLSRAYTYEAVLNATHGREAASAACIETARSLLVGRDAPVYTAIVNYADCVSKSMLHQWREAAKRWPMLLYQLNAKPGLQSVRIVAASRYAHTLQIVGELRALTQMAPSWLLTTRDLGFHREDAIIAALTAHAKLLLGDGPRAEIQTLRARASNWEAPGYGFPNFYIDLCEVAWLNQLDRFDEALARCNEGLQAAKRWGLVRFEIVEHGLLDARARTCVAALVSNRERPALIEQARADAKRLRRARRPMLRGQAATIEAGLAAIRGERAAAVAAWVEAAEQFELAGMNAHLAAVSLRLAALLDGADADERRAVASSYLERQKLDDAASLLAQLAPAP